jgi:hypothetical protein
MVRHLRSRLKALPVLDPAVFSLKCTISRLICISEPSLQVASGMTTIKCALDKLSDAEFDGHTRPLSLASAAEAITYMNNRQAESSQYLWEQQGHYLFLLARGEIARSRGVPGVAFEFLTRTRPSVWTVRRIPDPRDVLSHVSHFERNELVCYSQRPVTSQTCLERNSGHGGLFRLRCAMKEIAATLLA